MVGYIFGEGTGIDSAQELQRKRAMVEALQGQVASAAPRTFGQGINAVGKALAARVSDRAIGKKEDAERERLSGMYGEIVPALMGSGSSFNGPMTHGPSGMFGDVYGGGTPPVTTTPLTPNPGNLPQNIIDAVDRVNPQDPAMAIRAGLVSRGLPEHVADGFVMNFRDESGLNPGINEAEPMVPGSRGGFGLAQWTGPRRRQLEAFAQQQGRPVDDEDLQLDFLMSELQGPESRAAQSILSTKDAGSAAAAIASDFLRPAPEHLNRRVAQYTGQQPQRPQGVNPQIVAQLSEMAANPYLPEGQRAVVQALLQQQMQSMDPMRALEMERAQLELEQMRNPQPGYRQVSGAELGLTGEQAGAMFNVGPDGKVSQIGGGGVTVNTGDQGPRMGTIPQGYTAIEDPSSPAGYRMVPIPGGPEDTASSDSAAASNRETATSIITTAAQRAREANDQRLLRGPLSGVGAMNPASANAELLRQVDVLKSNAKVENLQAMREASPTGGALGAVSDSESAMLAAKSGALDPASPNFARDLDDYERTLLRIVHGREAGDAIFEQSRTGPNASEPDSDGWTTINGVRIREVK